MRRRRVAASAGTSSRQFPSRQRRAAPASCRRWVGTVAGDARDGARRRCRSAWPPAIYLEEYAPKNWFTGIIEINVTNLAGVPSIVYGLLALGLFVYQFGFGQSVLTAGLTLALLILPIVIVATREALRSVPEAIREAAYGARRDPLAE
ncbi:MAG: ABC transporter permease subunit [Chromatiales bacterium]|nr:ABC transporter permease subunit [Chromatiales bacterium]